MTRSAASRAAAAAMPASGFWALARAIASDSESVDCAKAGTPATNQARRSGTARNFDMTRAILRDLALPSHARAVQLLDRESGETRMLCGDATKLCRAS